ncbi:MAG TPA: chloride channel protein [Vicinamibacterales bacterium]|nr:chloride channel protein [Vicinamibacterales bacterium]
MVGLLLQFVVPYARGSGIPEVKYEFQTTAGARLSLRTVIGKFALGALAIGAGFSLGREGPTVQICAGLGALLGRLTHQGTRITRSLICIGAAAGIAAAFNTPIAAITFALEEIAGNLNQRLVGAIVVAAVAAAVVEHAILGGAPVFTIPAYAFGPWWELLAYGALGVVAAITATIFVKTLLWMRAAVRRLDVLPPWTRPAVAGVLVGAIGVAFPAVLGIGYQTLSRALLGEFGFTTMAALGVAKLAATIVSYSWGLAGGIFAPSLYIGGMIGGSCGAVVHRLLPDAPNVVGSFALVGMGAFFAGAIRAPITSILIIFEMTGDYAIILPLMVANMIAYTIAMRWQPVPIYDALLQQDGLHLADHEPAPLRRIRVDEAMTKVVETAAAAEPLSNLRERLAQLAINAVPIVDAEGHLIGMVTTKDAARGSPAHTAADVMRRPVVTAYGDQTLEAAVLKMARHGVRQLPVVLRDDPRRIMGILALHDVQVAASAARDR